MATALILYGSTTGNTESMSEIVKKALEGAGIEAEMKEVAQADPKDMTGDQDVVLLGCPAYGDDEIELQEDFQDFYEQWNGLELDGKKFAVFAPGDSSYEHFCGSVDLLQEKMEEMGGQKVNEGLKVDGDPEDAEDEITSWSKAVAASVS